MKAALLFILAFAAYVYAQTPIIPPVYNGATASDINSPVTGLNAKIPLSNFVYQWSNAIITATRAQNIPGGQTGTFGLSPLFNSTRLQALLHVAIHDTIQGFDKAYAQYQTGLSSPPAKANIQAAVTGAGFTIFESYFGNGLEEIAKYQYLVILQTAILEQNGVSSTKITNGFNYGASVATSLLASRANDGYNNDTPFVPQTSNGFFRPTPPDFPTPVGANWGGVTPWGLPNPVTSYFPPQPGNTYFTNSTAYINDYLEVIGKGRDTFDKTVTTVRRTGIETFIAAHYDNDLYGTHLPPGLYLLIAQDIGVNLLKLDRGNLSRMLAYVGMVLANANIAAWAVKYTFQEWRPVSGIQLGATDDFPATPGDPNWFPLSVVSPAFPDYISGHGTFGYGFANVLRLYLGTDNIKFSIFSDATGGRVSATYQKISDFATDNGLSRIFLGAHFRRAAVDTQFTGEPIGADVFNLNLRPL